MLLTNGDIRHLVMERAPGSAIKQAALQHHMVTLRDCDSQKAREGITTVNEVLRVTQDDL